jgi:hypothetical protein
MGLVGGILFTAVIFLYPGWRIFRQAGFPPALSLVVLIPGFGVLIAIVILAFVPWPTHRGGFGGLAAGDG